MKTSCAGAIRGLWDELNQGLFPWIDDNIGELDAAHRLFMAVCEAVIKPREFEYAKWKGNGRPPASRLKIFKAFLLKAVLNVKDTKELVRMLRAEPLSRRLCGWDRDTPGMGKIYSFHEPQVECIAKGKVHTRHSFCACTRRRPGSQNSCRRSYGSGYAMRLSSGIRCRLAAVC